MRRPAPDSLDPKIHHNNLLPSILAKIEANVAGADDAVMLDHRGFIAETNATHIFMVSSGALLTPTTASCPEGITRATVLRLAADAGLAVAEGDYTLPQLYNADEAFVTGTMGGLAPVVSVDGRVDRRRGDRPRHQAAHRGVPEPHGHHGHHGGVSRGRPPAGANLSIAQSTCSIGVDCAIDRTGPGDTAPNSLSAGLEDGFPRHFRNNRCIASRSVPMAMS